MGPGGRLRRRGHRLRHARVHAAAYRPPRPARVLRQSEAIGRALNDIRDPKTFDDHYSGAVDYDSFRCGVEAAAEFFAEALASIYPGDTEAGS